MLHVISSKLAIINAENIIKHATKAFGTRYLSEAVKCIRGC